MQVRCRQAVHRRLAHSKAHTSPSCVSLPCSSAHDIDLHAVASVVLIFQPWQMLLCVLNRPLFSSRWFVLLVSGSSEYLATLPGLLCDMRTVDRAGAIS
mmetsp:Transcript_5881/g.16492  ORF Transcript_5881/g.16492 Transcript_5881/m.16492 type:complete len:99 (-) Transcript_5881:458-754(-)